MRLALRRRGHPVVRRQRRTVGTERGAYESAAAIVQLDRQYLLERRAGQTALRSTVPIIQGTAAFVAIEFQFNADPQAPDTATVFFDPTPGLAAPDVPGLVKSDVNFGPVGDFFLLGANGMAFSFDPLRVGDTFADVAPAAGQAAVPEPSSFCIALVALSSLPVLCRYCRRRWS